jgi:hypothetical protein
VVGLHQLYNDEYYSPVLESQLNLFKDRFNIQVFFRMPSLDSVDTAMSLHEDLIGIASGASCIRSQTGPQICTLLHASGICREYVFPVRFWGFLST